MAVTAWLMASVTVAGAACSKVVERRRGGEGLP